MGAITVRLKPDVAVHKLTRCARGSDVLQTVLGKTFAGVLVDLDFEDAGE